MCALCLLNALTLYSMRKDEKGSVRQQNDRYPQLIATNCNNILAFAYRQITIFPLVGSYDDLLTR